MRLRVRQARPIDLNDAVRHAVELDAFQAADHRMHDNPTYARSIQSDEEKLDPISVLTKAVLDLQNEIKILKQERVHPVEYPTVDLQKRGGQKSTVVWDFCKWEGHAKAKCFKYLKSLNRAIEKSPDNENY